MTEHPIITHLRSGGKVISMAINGLQHAFRADKSVWRHGDTMLIEGGEEGKEYGEDELDVIEQYRLNRSHTWQDCIGDDPWDLYNGKWHVRTILRVKRRFANTGDPSDIYMDRNGHMPPEKSTTRQETAEETAERIFLAEYYSVAAKGNMAVSLKTYVDGFAEGAKWAKENHK
jgi:hypothetical protein